LLFSVRSASRQRMGWSTFHNVIVHLQGRHAPLRRHINDKDDMRSTHAATVRESGKPTEFRTKQKYIMCCARVQAKLRNAGVLCLDTGPSTHAHSNDSKDAMCSTHSISALGIRQCIKVVHSDNEFHDVVCDSSIKRHSSIPNECPSPELGVCVLTVRKGF